MREAETGENIFLKLYSFFKEMKLIRELNGTWLPNISRARIRDLTESHASVPRIAAVRDKPLIWIHCMAHKVELALSDAMMDRDYDYANHESKLYKWRVFTPTYFNQLRNFFGPTLSQRRRVLLQTAELFYEGAFHQLKQIIDVHWTSSEKESIHNFFYRYVIYQLQLLDIASTLSKSAQLPTSTLWQTQQQLDITIPTIKRSADTPNDYELTKTFLEMAKWSNASLEHQQKVFDSML
ncbi:hypothetical protein Aduo_016051 [Ancylostoma duodenale]